MKKISISRQNLQKSTFNYSKFKRIPLLWIDIGAFLSTDTPLNKYPQVVLNKCPCIGATGKFLPVVVVDVVDTLFRSCFRLCKWDGCFCMSLFPDTTVGCLPLPIPDAVFPCTPLSVVRTGELSNQNKVHSHYANPFLHNVPFPYPLKTTEKLWFQGVLEMEYCVNIV